jgi:hypothetical protein
VFSFGADEKIALLRSLVAARLIFFISNGFNRQICSCGQSIIGSKLRSHGVLKLTEVTRD